MFALILMFSAQVINVVGYMRQDYRTVVGAILSIISGQLTSTEHAYLTHTTFLQRRGPDYSSLSVPECSTGNSHGYSFVLSSKCLTKKLE